MGTEHWESYYRGGALVSCPTNPEPYYTMEVRDAWVGFFSLLGDGDRVLDLGTGNGPVALIASETAADSGFELHIDGVDLADIDPAKYVPDGERLLRGIHFHGGVSTEALPFDEASFAAVSGQYIVEYTDAAKTLAEALRVLEPGGRCQFILHHSDSLIVRNGIESLRQAELVHSETRTMRKFRRYCELAAESPRRAESARRQLMAAGERLQREADRSANPLLLQFVIDSIVKLLRNRSRLGRGELLKQTNLVERELKNWVRRLRDLVSSALSQEDIEGLARIAGECGFADVLFEIQTQGGDKLVGWRMTLRRPD